MYGAMALKKPSITEQALASIRPPVPASFPIGQKWFVASVWQDGKAVKEIRKLGFDVFSPTQGVVKITRGRKVLTNKPIFPGYLFVRFDREREDWGQINDINGVIGILDNMQIPCAIPDLVIERLRNWVDAGVFERESSLQSGQAVEITEGPFMGLLAKVRSASPRKRARVVLDGFMAVIDIDTCFLRKA